MDHAAGINVVRQHERHACSLPGVVTPQGASVEQVTVARSIATVGGGVPVTVVDCSNGGAGAHSRVFVPRGCMVSLSVQAGEGAPAVLANARVQRVIMIDRAPRYYLGLAFVGGEELTKQTVDRLAAMIQPGAGSTATER